METQAAGMVASEACSWRLGDGRCMGRVFERSGELPDMGHVIVDFSLTVAEQRMMLLFVLVGNINEQGSARAGKSDTL